MSSSLSKFGRTALIKDADLFVSGATQQSTADDVIFITVQQADGRSTQGRFVLDQVKGTWTATIPAGSVQPGPALASGLLATLSPDPQFPGHKTFCWADTIEIEPLPTSRDEPES